MGQDIRKLFQEEQLEEMGKMHKGHEGRFISKLDRHLPIHKKGYARVFKIAAAVLLLASLGGVGYYNYPAKIIKTDAVVQTDPNKINAIGLGDISPDLKKVEDYYLTNISYELSQIQIDADTAILFESYMNKLTELNDEYLILTNELNEIGPNEPTISAMIDNFQKRLKLLYQLKGKLQELKKSKNEQFKNKQV